MSELTNSDLEALDKKSLRELREYLIHSVEERNRFKSKQDFYGRSIKRVNELIRETRKRIEKALAELAVTSLETVELRTSEDTVFLDAHVQNEEGLYIPVYIEDDLSVH